MPEAKLRLSLSIFTPIHAALELEAAAKHMDVSDLAEIILEKHALDGPHLTSEAKKEIALFRELVLDVTQAATRIVEQQGFRDTITADAIAACVADPEWLEKYTGYVGDNPYKNGNPKKQNINPSFGYWVKKTLRASSKMKDGKPENRKVLDSIIQSYTPLVR